jgi:prophage regulatory protein|tara:strand:+ start:649 stop:912 length:264 start_codon:yes stop_codon:yes gene_type:complete
LEYFKQTEKICGMIEDEIWRLSKVVKATGMGKSWIYSQVSRGTFPKQVNLGARAVGWRRSDVLAWVQKLEVSENLKVENSTELTAEE